MLAGLQMKGRVDHLVSTRSARSVTGSAANTLAISPGLHLSLPAAESSTQTGSTKSVLTGATRRRPGIKNVCGQPGYGLATNRRI